MGRRRLTETTKRIRAALVANALLPPKERKNMRQLADELEVPHVTVRSVASRLYSAAGEDGVRIVSDKGPPIGATKPKTGGERAAEEREAHNLLLKVTGGQIADAADRRRALSLVIATGKHSDVVSASKALEEMERGTEAAVGLPPPSNRDEELHLLVQILQGTTRELAEEAMRIAYEEPTPIAPPSPEHEGPPASDRGVGGRPDGELRGEPVGTTGSGTDDLSDDRVSGPEE